VKTYITVYFGAAIVAMLLVPIVSRLAKRCRWVDDPGLRKVHKTPVPRVGGLVFIVATYLLVLPVFFVNNRIGESFRAEQTEYIVLLLGGALVFLVGFIDDLRSVRASTKLLCLVVASLAVCASGAIIHSISLGPWFELELGWLAWPIAVIWITTITVGMNFIDGLDGLAGGVAAIVCGTIALLALWNDQTAMAVLTLALLGSVMGFLFFNFHPAKIFMGDGGAMFLGFMIGAGSLVSQAKTCTLVGLAFPVLVLGVPILDAGFTVVRRGVLYRRSIFAAEKGHLHHRLLELGLPQRTAVIVIYAVTIISASIGMFMMTAPVGWGLALLAGGAVFLLAVFVGLGGARIRATITSMRKILAISREKKGEQDRFEDTQLQMGEAKSFKGWWDVLCKMGEDMQFQSMELCFLYKGRTAATCQRYLSGQNSQGYRTAEFVLPLQVRPSGLAPEVKIKVQKNGLLETPCRRVSLLGRLIDEFPPPLNGADRTSGTTVNPQQQVESTVPDGQGRSSLLKKTRVGTVNNGPMPARIDIMGVPVVPFESYDQALRCIEGAVESGERSLWVAVNPQKCYRAWYEPGLMEILQNADVGICDGIGVSIASRILHGRSIKRITGCDLFFKLLSLASDKNWGVFLLGASPESNARACINLRRKYPGLRIVGNQDGFFDDSDKVVEKINSSGADLLFVAMGSPKQEQWIWRHRKAINACFCMGVGGSFDVASGNLKRAPTIFQKTGTEFVFQLVTEPRKRWPRQKVYFPFMVKIISQRIFGSSVLAVTGKGPAEKRCPAELSHEREVQAARKISDCVM